MQQCYNNSNNNDDNDDDDDDDDWFSLTENETCLVDFLISKQTLTPGEMFYRAIYLET